jgi:hypothetical protein
MQNVSSIGQSGSVNENSSKNYGNLYPNDKSIYGGNTTMFNNLVLLILLILIMATEATARVLHPIR